jgi:flagella basal body P-ring formation protein FlgA
MRCSSWRITFGDKLVVGLLVVVCLLSGVLGITTAATQQQGTIQVPTEEVTQLVTRYLMERLPWPKQQVQITNLNLRGDLQVPQGQLTYEILPRSHHLSPGPVSLTIVVHVDGKPVRRLLAAGTINVSTKVVVAAMPLSRDQIITRADVRLEERILAQVPEGALTDLQDVVGKRPRRSIGLGRPLHARLLEAPPVIQRGAVVTILAKTPTLSVVMQGQAKEDGAVGEQIRLVNLSSRKEIYGRVIDENTVRVDF